MIKAIIVDDENSAKETLKALVDKHCKNIEIINLCANAKDGFEHINELQPDLVFLDVDMPKENGFDLLAKFEQPQFDVVFATGHDKYALQAIKSSAFDFLLKPIDINELKAVADRLEAKNQSKDSFGQQVETLMNHLKSDKPTKVAIPDAEGVHFINIPEIIRCEAAGNYTKLVLVTKEQILASKSLRDFESMFIDHQFVRVHQSHLVNLSKIKRFQKGEKNHLIMLDDVAVEVSRRKKAILEEHLNQLM